MGPTAGGAVYSPAMTDFIFMVKNTSYMFITGPDVIKSVTGEEITFEDLGGAMAHNMKSGVAHFACESDSDAIDQIKRLLSYLPNNNMEDPPLMPTADPAGREAPELDSIVPDSAGQSYDMHDVIAAIVDDGEFFEPHAHFAGNMLVALARMGGRPIGIIANNPRVLAGCLDCDAADKATRFIRFCDAFNIPLLTIADVPGYLPGSDQEWQGIIRHGAKLLWCYSEATVPKITLGDPEGLRGVVPGHVLPGPGRRHGHRLAHRRDRGDGGVRRGQRHLPERDQRRRGPGGQAGRDHRQLRDPALQPVHCGLAGLCGPGDHAPGDQAAAHRGVGDPEHQAGDPAGQEARQYTRVAAS